MPLYEYKCGSCGRTFEVFARTTTEQPQASGCCWCGSEDLTRVLTAPGAIQFKGSGFYATDYGKGAK